MATVLNLRTRQDDGVVNPKLRRRTNSPVRAFLLICPVFTIADFAQQLIMPFLRSLIFPLSAVEPPGLNLDYFDHAFAVRSDLDE